MLCYSEPHLELPLPKIAAAEEFSRLPILRKVFQNCGAFYIRRGLKKVDPELSQQLSTWVQDRQLTHPLLFFIEGTRSRSGQFLPPKRGLLRCLSSLTDDFTVLPVSLSYDRIPEFKVFRRETSKGVKSSQNWTGLLKWVKELYSGNVRMGRVHLSCGEPVQFSTQGGLELNANQVMSELQKKHCCKHLLFG